MEVGIEIYFIHVLGCFLCQFEVEIKTDWFISIAILHFHIFMSIIYLLGESSFSEGLYFMNGWLYIGNDKVRMIGLSPGE